MSTENCMYRSFSPRESGSSGLGLSIEQEMAESRSVFVIFHENHGRLVRKFVV